ncbi:MAG: BRO family protein [Halopseudomonas sp.]|uniref:BRO family protein n=1 Tax=Halopseudomonas sp. TaxID=2901191 RepID=UPI00300153DB
MTSTNIITHTFNTFPVRVVQMDGQPWFVAQDVLKALGLTTYTSAHYKKLASNELANISRITLGLNPGKPMVVVSESGLYKLIMRSDKPQAHAFQNWVTRDVLPAIRKDGAYVMGEEKVAAGERIPMTSNNNTTLHNHNAFYNEVVCAEALTMSSREIAELLDVRHDNVKRTVMRLISKDAIGVPPLEEYLDTLGRTAFEYQIGKRDSYVIVAQLSPEFTAKLVDRWQELEQQVAAPALPTSFAEALRLAAALEEQKETLRLENEAMKPDVQEHLLSTLLGRVAPPTSSRHRESAQRALVEKTRGTSKAVHLRPTQASFCLRSVRYKTQRSPTETAHLTLRPAIGCQQ